MPEENVIPPTNEPQTEAQKAESLHPTPPAPTTSNEPAPWKEYEIDNTKSIEENAALKAEHDKSKPAEEKPAEVKPLTVEDIKLPEGFEADGPIQEKFVGILNDDKLSPQDRANALVALQAEALKAASEKASQQWEDFNKQQIADTQRDPEVGGAKLEANLGTISKLLDAHGTPELRLVMDNSGAGNNVEVVRFLTKIAGLVAEGKPAVGAPSDGGNKTQAQTMFPNMKG
jgi:hypothetical protein